MAATPPTRDRYVDFLRAASITLVVLGHWLISVVLVTNGHVTATNALATVPWLRVLTWVFQVMPVFFFVGGFSNQLAVDHQRTHGRGYGDYLRRRTDRLLRPTIVFALVWLVVARLFEALSLDRSLVHTVAKLAAQPLWFLAVYLVVVALAPPMLAFGRRNTVAPFVVLSIAVITIDVVRFHWGEVDLATVNYGLVFLFAQQLGFLYADGWLTRLPVGRLAAVSATALGLLVLLTTVGTYPVSMVGVPGEAISNMSPPTVCILVLTIAQVALVMALRGPASRWLQARGPWTVTVAVNARIMTLFLWHLTAIVAAGGLLLAVGLPTPAAGAAGWWALRIVWIASSAIVLAGLILLFGRFETSGEPPTGETVRRATAWISVVGLALAVRGLIGLALTGFARVLVSPRRSFMWMRPSPALDVALIVVGYLLVVGLPTRRRPPVGPSGSDRRSLGSG